jgi:hypothetical protein
LVYVNSDFVIVLKQKRCLLHAQHRKSNAFAYPERTFSIEFSETIQSIDYRITRRSPMYIVYLIIFKAVEFGDKGVYRTQISVSFLYILFNIYRSGKYLARYAPLALRKAPGYRYSVSGFASRFCLRLKFVDKFR